MAKKNSSEGERGTQMRLNLILNRIANNFTERNQQAGEESTSFANVIQFEMGYIWPVKAGRPAITQGFHSGHGGIDIQNRNNVQGYPTWNPLPESADTPSGSSAAGTGNPVCAVRDGVVSFRFERNSNAGNGFVIAHGRGYFTRYLHLHEKDFGELPSGSYVHQSQQMGLTGQTGSVFSSGHLHFDIVYVPGRRIYSAKQDAELFCGVWFSNNITGTERGYKFWKHNPRLYLPDDWVWAGNFNRGHNDLRNS